jgi:hypothetical protein
MRIAEIHIYRHSLPVHNGPYKMAHSEGWFHDAGQTGSR